MIKIFVFLTLGLITLCLVKKLISNLTKNLMYQYVLYIFTFLIFLFLIFLYRGDKLHDEKGSYSPPYYDGKQVIPGNITNE